ncbi:hypothetical protein [Mycobacteroides abscessus]|uniref:hypothetical protein n=1 Tax=Mycobacteroides abscessus TaxID=36809 RepID=UPI000C2588B2|nr:hypothetical protein [Mycobacteroides abscessus]
MTTEAPYDVTLYLCGENVWCRATWTWRATGETVTVTEDYLNLEGGKPVLCCGIYDAAAALDLPDAWFEDDRFVLAVSAKVDRQLALRPCAEVRCPVGTLTVELVSPPADPAPRDG